MNIQTPPGIDRSAIDSAQSKAYGHYNHFLRETLLWKLAGSSLGLASGALLAQADETVCLSLCSTPV
jgi:hypothetical protein